MSKSKLQIDLEYGVARLVIAVFAGLPLRAAMRAGAGLAVCFSWFAGRLRRTGERNLEIAFPELPIGERRRLLRLAFRNLGRLLGVFSQFNNDSQRLQQLIVCEGLDHLSNAQSAARSVMLFTGHIGALVLSRFAL